MLCEELEIPYKPIEVKMIDAYLEVLRKNKIIKHDHTIASNYRNGEPNNVWEYVKPTEEGAAAKIDRARKPKASPAGSSAPVAGVGKLAKALKHASKDVKGLIEQVTNNGGQVDVTEKGHFIIRGNGERIIMAPQPNSSGFVKDRARLRRSGLITA